MKFIVIDGGDPSVGIWGGEYEVDIPGDWNEVDIKEIKDFLTELYDVEHTGTVMTEKEYEEERALALEMEESFVQHLRSNGRWDAVAWDCAGAIIDLLEEKGVKGASGFHKEMSEIIEEIFEDYAER